MEGISDSRLVHDGMLFSKPPFSEFNLSDYQNQSRAREQNFEEKPYFLYDPTSPQFE